MKTKAKSTMPAKLAVELEEVLSDLATGRRDPEVMKRAAREMDRMREVTRAKLGYLDVAVQLIREGREGT